MSVDFKRIKKYFKASKDIDEKLEYLNKELKKTGLREAMTTNKMYQMPNDVPNQDYINFNGLSQGGYALGLSGADGNSLGGAINGINPSTNQPGVALSPPHPVTGVRRVASTVLDGVGSNRALRPGKGTRFSSGPPPRTITDGSAVWFFDPNYASGEGQWFNFEWFDGELGFWDTTGLGFFFHNTNLDDFQLSGVNVGTQIKNKIDSINFGANGEIGAPQTTVLTQTKLDDSGFLPINIDLSIQAFNFLKNKAKGFFNKALDFFKGDFADNLNKALTIADIALTAISIAGILFPEPTTSAAGIAGLAKVLSKLKLLNTGKKGLGLAKGLKGMKVGATGLKSGGFKALKGGKGLHSGSKGLLSPGGKGVYSAPKVGKVGSSSLNPGTGGAKYSKFGSNPFSSFSKGGTGAGSSPGGVVGSIVPGGAKGIKIFEPQSVVNPSTFKKGSKLFKQVMDGKYSKSATAKKIKKMATDAGFGSGQSSISFDKLPKLMNSYDYDGFYLIESVVSDEQQNEMIMQMSENPKLMEKLPQIIKVLELELELSELFVLLFGDESEQKVEELSADVQRESLNESVRLGHFEPEVLNVNIDDLRKGIAPEFPKDPPPEMIDGYAANSRLAPKKIEGSPFINITKKDLAKNHLLTDKQISDFMNDIKMINDYIKKNPADLIYAQQRYPKHDPRLAQLNWQMDQMLDAGKEYIDKQFPENQKLFNQIKKKIKNTIDQTDPKNFKGTKLPKFDKTHLEDFKRKKEVYSRFMKKPVKTKKLFQKKGLTYK